MIDHRIQTFLKLCQVMNYRKTAELLNLTQPAVTQHIQHLERQYGCKLFLYQERALTKTEACIALEKHALSLLYNDTIFRKDIQKPPIIKVALGATKTIGDYVINARVLELLARKDVQLEFVVDNTEHLLALLNDLKLDILLIEGFFSKKDYGYQLMKTEQLVGICASEHPFANRTVALEEIFSEHLILREDGSGTRSVFEDFLHQRGYATQNFAKTSVLSSFPIIESAVSANLGISFVYEAIPRSNDKLATFTLQNGQILHEFNFVFLKNANIHPILQLLQPE